MSTPIPFKPETWPEDADGFAPNLCTECGTPVRYGSRHTDCGRKAMGLLTVAEARAALSAPAAHPRPATGWTHTLKTDPEVFDAVQSGAKTHEIRRNDRGFAVGDLLVLRRTEHTGEEMRAGAPLVYSPVPALHRTVTHVLTGYGLSDGWCILSLATAPQTQPEDHVARELAAASRTPPMQWPQGKAAGRVEDMGQGHLRVVLDSDNDACVAVWDGKHSAGIEFCNPGACGGGRSRRTRAALIALMCAIEADNAERPDLAWPPSAAQAQTATTKAQP